jgi:hypothetical protein
MMRANQTLLQNPTRFSIGLSDFPHYIAAAKLAVSPPNHLIVLLDEIAAGKIHIT